MYFKTVLACALVASFAASAASAKQMHCKVRPSASQGGGWVSDEYLFDYSAKTGNATAYDEVINHFLGEPVDAKWKHKEGAKEVFDWRVLTTDKIGQQVYMDYRAVYFYHDKSFAVSGTPPGYTNDFSGRGTCEFSGK